VCKDFFARIQIPVLFTIANPQQRGMSLEIMMH
jgi:hypothetical protein